MLVRLRDKRESLLYGLLTVQQEVLRHSNTIIYATSLVGQEKLNNLFVLRATHYKADRCGKLNRIRMALRIYRRSCVISTYLSCRESLQNPQSHQ